MKKADFYKLGSVLYVDIDDVNENEQEITEDYINNIDSEVNAFSNLDSEQIAALIHVLLNGARNNSI